MKFSNLFSFFTGKKQKKIRKEYIFGLLLKEEGGIGLILEIDYLNQKVKTIGEKKFRYSDGWENLTEDVDEELSELEEMYEIKTKKIILFLYSHLVDQENKQIKQPYLSKIKKMTKELELEPLGYIENQEALIDFLKEKEEISPSVIIIELDTTSISIFIYKASQLIETKTVSRTDNYIFDIEMVFREMKKELILPTRMIIYDQDFLEDEINKIETYQWDQSLFIQIPKQEIFTLERLKEASIMVFSKQVFKLEPTEEETITEKEQSEVAGFLINQDIKVKTEREEFNFSKKTEIKDKKNLKKMFFHGCFLNLSNIKVSSWLIFLFGFLLVFGSLFLILNYLHRAKITLYFPAKVIEKEINIPEKELILINKDKTLEKEENLTTTGRKTIGEKAKGEITIYNSTTEEKQFNKGTILESEDGLKFSLDNDVKIASASQTITNDGNFLTVTGKTKTKISALEIGSTYNIKKNQKLKVGNSPITSIFALTTENFTGGSQKQIKTVSQEDQKNIKKNIEEKIKKEAQLKIKDDLKNHQIINYFTKIEILEEKFSHEIGEESDNLFLKVKAKVIFSLFQKDQMKKIVSKYLKESINEKLPLEPKEIFFEFKEVKEEKEKNFFLVKAKGKFLPKMEKEEWTKKVKGKKLRDLEKVVKEEFGALGFDVKMEKDLLYLNSLMPFFEKNIIITVNSL